MDSASSTLSVAVRDGSSFTDDDGSLSVAAGLGKEAASLFHAGKFVECLAILNQLLMKKVDDPKVCHNMIIVENLQDGCLDPKKLVKALENIKKQIKHLSHASGEHLEVSRNSNSKPTPDMKENNEMTRFSRLSVVCDDEFGTSVAMYNIAVVWFHLHEYEKAFLCLETLYQNILPIDERTALRVCLLLLDVALHSHQALRSANVIDYMEKVFYDNFSTNLPNGGTSAQQQALLGSKLISMPSDLTIPDASHADAADTVSMLENSLTRSLSEEALEEESLQLSSLNISAQNLRRPCIAASNDLSRSVSEESLSATDLRLKLHLYKVRFFLLARNLKAAKREAKMAMNTARGKDYPIALYLKSQLEYARGNHHKAIKLLIASGNRTESAFSSMYFNNLGCIYYRIGKHHTSGVFFSKALDNSFIVRKEKPPKLTTLSQDKSLMIIYNCGVMSLTCGRPFHAARCFQTASLMFYNHPLLWLRIAECCLMALEKGMTESIFSANDRSHIRANIIGSGKLRQLALRYGNSPNVLQGYTGGHSLFLGNSKHPDLSISLARQCLVNVLYLLDSSRSKFCKSSLPPCYEESEPSETVLSQSANHKNAPRVDPRTSNTVSGSSQVTSNGGEQKGGNYHGSSLHNLIPEYDNIRMKENHIIKQAALADLAYVELALGNPLKAVSTARSLLKLPECSRMYIFLGNMYAAEALCMLNKPKEAAEHLMRYVSGGNVELPYSQEDCGKWTAENGVEHKESIGGTPATNVISSTYESKVLTYSTPEEARGIFYSNFAANLALLGDLEQAHHFVRKALSVLPNDTRAIFTGIYVDLRHGKTNEALVKLKQHSGVRFLHSILSANDSF